VRYDVAHIVAGFGADVVVVSESWRADDGRGLLDPLTDAGFHVESVQLMHLRYRRERERNHEVVPSTGVWELAICSRFPIVARRELPIGRLKLDPAGARHALGCTVDLGDRTIEVVGLHTSSRVYLLAPVRHLIELRRQIAAGGTSPDVMAGDFNLWGPPVSAIFPGWQRAVRGRTYPSYRPHSQIDHIIVRERIAVVSGEVLAATPSDHRPIRARLRVEGQVT